jgi:nicotinate (nicotinamide) nucleotide adenylyltransferase
VSRFILLFGTSANPPTGMGGHLGVVVEGAAREGVDEVWILPVFRHAFEHKREMPSFEHRFRMAELAFATVPKARVIDAERRCALAMGTPARVGTVDVVRMLIAENPSVRFGLLLGADTHQDLVAGRWKESDALRSLVEIVPVPRVTDVSSTQCRASRSHLEANVVPSVREYIERHGLYEER